MAKRALITVSVLLIVASTVAVVRGQRVNRRPTFMRIKLIHSQKVLEGLVLEDYETIAKHAKQMKLLSQEANWQPSKPLQKRKEAKKDKKAKSKDKTKDKANQETYASTEYEQQSVQFRLAANALVEAADNRNLDGVTLAYGQLTMSCVNCHKYIRSSLAPVQNVPARR